MWPDPHPQMPPVPASFTEHVFASKAGVQLRLRVWPAPERPKDKSLVSAHGGWVLWSHGGAFAAGEHFVPTSWAVPGFLSRGYTVVSYAYRLSPAAGLDEMVEDGADALAWCRGNLRSLTEVIDPDAWVAAGDSAGGTLALLNGLLAPAPRAVVDVYGIADLSDARYEPSIRGPGFVPAPESGNFSEAQLEAAIAERDAAQALASVPFLRHYGWDGSAGWNAGNTRHALGHWAARARVQLTGADRHIAETVAGASDGHGHFLYTAAIAKQADVKCHLESTGRIIRALLRREQYKDDAAYLAAARARGPLGRIEAAQTYPPTVFLSGTADKVVPVEHSQNLAKLLRAKGVPVAESYEPGEDHAWDNKYTSPKVEGWDTYIVPVLDFVDKHIGTV